MDLHGGIRTCSVFRSIPGIHLNTLPCSLALSEICAHNRDEQRDRPSRDIAAKIDSGQLEDMFITFRSALGFDLGDDSLEEDTQLLCGRDIQAWLLSEGRREHCC